MTVRFALHSLSQSNGEIPNPHQVSPDSPVELSEARRRELCDLLEEGRAEGGPGPVVERLDQVRVEGGGALRAVRVVHLEPLPAT